jgi:solute carrier family 5 (sodium-coupled monocarboxylate transporter), member 8/12
LGHLPGISGLFVAGIFSGSLSSVSSTLNSLAAVTLEDYYKPLYLKIKKTPWKASSASVSKIIAFTYGIICIGGAFLAQFLGGILQASLILFGVVGGPLLGLFTLGMATEIANEYGVVPSLLIGIGLSLWIGFSPKPPVDRQLVFSTEDCSEFGGILNNSTIDKVEDDKR